MSFNTSESALLSHISNMNLSLKASSFSSVPKKRSQPSSTSGTSKNTRQGTVSPVLDCQPTPEISGRTENHRTESALVGHIGNMNLSFGSLSFPSVPKAQPPASRTSGRSNDIPRDTMTHAEASEKSSGISGSQAAHYDKVIVSHIVLISHFSNIILSRVTTARFRTTSTKRKAGLIPVSRCPDEQRPAMRAGCGRRPAMSIVMAILLIVPWSITRSTKTNPLVATNTSRNG